MQVMVTFRHTESTPALKAYAEEKIQKVEKFLHAPQECNVVLSVEKIRHIAEVLIIADGLTITGKEETSDLYSASVAWLVVFSSVFAATSTSRSTATLRVPFVPDNRSIIRLFE